MAAKNVQICIFGKMYRIAFISGKMYRMGIFPRKKKRRSGRASASLRFLEPEERERQPYSPREP